MDRTDVPVRIYIPGKSIKIAENYGLVLKIQGNQLRIYAMENFDHEDMKRAGALWIYFNFLDELLSNVTGADLTPDRDAFFAEFLTQPADDDSAGNPLAVVHTFKELLHRCSAFGLDQCEPDQLQLPDGTIWDQSLTAYLGSAEQNITDEGLIRFTGGKAEGNYLHLNLEGWNYPDGVFRIDPACFEAAATSSDALTFQVTIPNREVYWCYHLIQPDTAESLSYAVRTVNSRESTDENLPEFEQIETIGFSGAKKALRFCTTSPIAMRNRYPFTIELEGQNRSDSPRILPYPGAQVLSSIERSGKDELCSDIYLYL